MTPVKQTIIDDQRGNCFQACVASLLDLPLEQVPHFLEEAGEQKSVERPFKKWLDERGLEAIQLWFNDWESIRRTYLGFGKYVIASGTSPRRREDGKTKSHAVVAKTQGWGLELIHDPHPDDSFLDTKTTMQEGGWGCWIWFIMGKAPDSTAFKPITQPSADAARRPVAESSLTASTP